MEDITAKEVRQIASLAHLQLSDDELSFYQQYLTKILSYVENIKEIDLSDLSDDSVFASDVISCERDDHVTSESLDFTKVSEEAPDMVTTSFRVPRIIE